MADVTLTVNGARVQVDAPPGTRLLEVLRHDLALTGASSGAAKASVAPARC